MSPSACRRERLPAGVALTGLGLPTTTDLRLLGGGPEAEELMEELQAAGLLLGDRAKIWLLVGDRTHIGRLSINDDPVAESQMPRRLQAHTAETALKADSGDMSTDTIAIMLTVLVGAAGYAMQAYIA